MPNENEETQVSLVIAEDNLDLSQTVQDFIGQSAEIRLLGAAGNEGQFKALVEKYLPDLALIDIGLDTPRSGLNLLDWIKTEYPVVKPVIMTVNESDVLEAYNKGARGYVLKTELQILVPTLLDVHRGKMVIPPNVGELFVKQVAAQAALWKKSLELERFSDREKEILRMLKAEVPREKIADTLSISFFTVRRHIQNILEKSGEGNIRKLIDKYGKLLEKG
jgi:DNA-binding NarL/FixJ family response regulator